MALIFIKYYLDNNFNEVYDEIVRQELEVQTKKISKKQAAKDKLDKEIKGTR